MMRMILCYQVRLCYYKAAIIFWYDPYISQANLVSVKMSFFNQTYLITFSTDRWSSLQHARPVEICIFICTVHDTASARIPSIVGSQRNKQQCHVFCSFLIVYWIKVITTIETVSLYFTEQVKEERKLFDRLAKQQIPTKGLYLLLWAYSIEIKWA